MDPSHPRSLRPPRRMFWAVTLALSLGGAVCSAVVACGTTHTYIWACRLSDGTVEDGVTATDVCPCDCCINPQDGDVTSGCVDGGADADAEADASEDADADAPLSPGCTGTCLPAKPDGWEDPQLVAIGTPQDMPSCPGVAPAVIYEGYAGLDMSPASCSACSCAAPSGSCGLPATVTASTSAACVDAGAALTPFDPPGGWDGGCTSEDAVPSAALCGGVPCVRSLTIAPLTVQESGCTPSASSGMMTIPAVSWSTYAVACIGNASGSCAEGGDFCAALAPVEGFRECIFHDGDVDCPSYGAYTDQLTFYASAVDTRSCSACACGAPAGSTCSAYVSIYSDPSCSPDGGLLGGDLVGSDAPGCLDVIPGSALGSKSAGAATYVPGTCPASGGEPTGSVAPFMPGTFCCLPSL